MAAAGSKAALLALACAACTSIAADARTFENTHWRVTAVNGRATPANGDYSLSFEGGRIGARFGCNSIGGRYRVIGDALAVSQLVSTMMACGEPADSFEHSGSAILNSRMRMYWSSSQRLTLSNGGGSIALELLP